ncbi:uncharacterized protein FOMMEDRAFT_149572 [Fomitiporia mediterranea MF3/22]|uniref:PAS domain-containing protein n=1 Tax=Fomitiporia mediterranea (strain MF3/22) TaxID=694068 RepID=R7SJL5_FOMME|nr:uncharacterized protein FOMMEDRAFT_149572 [Fomitiporia mediterranea MF3/22]EJC97769.1 hypothetical protein FOMMEDRAFT_149572 [Fomitiporia mediterranea MF3/22]
MDLSRIINPPEDETEPPRTEQRSPSVSPRPVSPVTTDAGEEPDWIRDDLPNLSFIVCMEAVGEGKCTYVSPTALHLMGWSPEEVIGTPAALYAHPDDVPQLYRAYQEMISEDKAACLMYHRIPFKDKSKGYLLCRITNSRVGQHIIGACAPAKSSTKNMHTASTAQETVVITPSAKRLAFTRWNVPPMPTYSSEDPTSSRETSPPTDGASDSSSTIHDELDPLTQAMRNLTLSQPEKQVAAKRVAFVLDRFSTEVPIIYCTNDDIVPKPLVTGRSFYDFVAAGDEKRIRAAIDQVKTWGVNEEGSPSDGGYAFNRFHMHLKGRDRQLPDPSRKHATGKGAQHPDILSRKTFRQRASSERGINVPVKEIQMVDSIFSPQSDGIIVILRESMPPKR